jgi:DNA invertase Pin-like site-specific DNA recombinase
MIRGYARVSTGEQSLALQIQALTGAGCDVRQIYTDRIGGAAPLTARPGFTSLSRALTAEDHLVVWRLDRLSRSLPDLTAILAEFRIRCIRLVSLTENLDASNASGQLVVNVLASMAQYERETLRERVNAGIAAARATAETWGRPAALRPAAIKSVRKLAADGVPIAQIARTWNVARSTVRACVGRMPPYDG